MTTQPNDIVMRTIDTLVEAATKLRELQLEAAANADAGAQMQACLAQFDQAYKQWLATAQQLYKLPAIPS